MIQDTLSTKKSIHRLKLGTFRMPAVSIMLILVPALLASLLMIDPATRVDAAQGETAGPCSMQIWWDQGEWEPAVLGQFNGTCLAGKPHGKGTITDFYSEEPVRGTWENGKYHGTMSFSFSPDFSGDNPIRTWTCQYRNGIRHGDLIGLDKYHKKCVLMKYSNGKLVSETWFYPNGQPARTADRGAAYISKTLASLDAQLRDFNRFMITDFAHRRSLTHDQRIEEILELQQTIETFDGNQEIITEKGIMVYPANVVARGNVISMMHMNRMIDLSREFASNVYRLKDGRSANSEYLMGYLASWNNFVYTVPEKQPKKEAIVNALKGSTLPPEITRGLKVFITPFSLSDTNGEYVSSVNTIILYGGQDFKWPASESCAGHEMGHMLMFKTFDKEDVEHYWKLREVPPTKFSSYDHPWEVLAEDGRVLYGGIDNTTRRRSQPGMYGDIRDYPDKMEKVKKFLDAKIKKFIRKGSPETQVEVILNPNRTPWLWRQGSLPEIKVEITTSDPYKVMLLKQIRLSDNDHKYSDIYRFDHSRGSFNLNTGSLDPGVYELSISNFKTGATSERARAVFIIYN